MSEIKALKELRDIWSLLTAPTQSDKRLLADMDACIKAIEAEIADRYMLLPVDADGVPWHIGDITENRNVVNGIAFDRHGAHFISTLNDIDPNIHTHFKPRTLEDVLADFAADVENDRNTIETARKYADEIRELLGR